MKSPNFRIETFDTNKFTIITPIILVQVRVSEMSATSPDEVHVPKLWYYDLMLFLKDQEVPRQSKRAYSIIDEKSCDDEVKP